MRAVLTAGEADELVRTLPDAPAEWIDNDSRRKETFSAMLRSGDRSELVAAGQNAAYAPFGAAAVRQKVPSGRRTHAA